MEVLFLFSYEVSSDDFNVERYMRVGEVVKKCFFLYVLIMFWFLKYIFISLLRDVIVGLIVGLMVVL